MSATPVTTAITGIFSLPKSVATFVSDVVSAVHKEASLVMGVLVALGVTPTPAADTKVTSGILVGYAAIVQFAEKIFGKSSA